MKSCIRVVLSFAALYFALTSLAFAADDSYLFIVHGIPGRDVAAFLDPTLPVDVLVNDDTCVTRGVAFGTVFGPITLPSGQYNIKMSPSDPFVPCSKPALVETNVTLNPSRNVTAIAALDQNGKPKLSTYVNDVSPVTQGNARIILTNTANAPQLQITLQLGSQKYTYNVNPGSKMEATIPAGAYDIEVEANGTVLVPSQPLPLPPVSDNLIYAVGSASNGSVVLITKTVRDVL